MLQQQLNKCQKHPLALTTETDLSKVLINSLHLLHLGHT